jgi:alpha-beta hydrolase superfamily lysophospholipase
METLSPAPGDTLAAGDGVPLHLHAWPAHASDRTERGRVLIVHGLGEHGGRHAALADRLCRQGWRVHAYDQRGHGRSGGARGALPHPDALLDDLARVIDHLGLQAAGGGRFVLLGHSMGGAVAARFVAEALAARPAAWSREPDALVLSSPALDPGMSRMQWLRLWIGERLLPDLAQGNGLDPSWVSRDPEVVRAYVADPLVHDRITARLARFVVDAGVRVRADAPRWRVPTLLMWGGADRCVAPAGSAAMAAAAPPGVLTARPFEGLAHEIFNEPERERVLAALTAWLSRRPGAGA